MKKLSDIRYMQYVAAFAAALSGPVAAVHITWASPSLPILQSPDSPFELPVTDEEGSWLVSLLYLVTFPGALISAFIARNFGRKASLLLGATISLISWIIILFTHNLQTLYIARIIASISMGVITTINYIYVGEIADDDIRGKLGMIGILLTPIFSMIILSAGPYISYKAISLICSATPVLFIAVFVWMPETPHFFIKKGDVEAARRSLIRLSASDINQDVINEKIIILQKINGDDKLKKKLTLLQLLTNWRYLKPFVLVTGIMLVCLFSGGIAIESYMQTIISASGSSLSPESSSIIFGIVKIPPVFIAIVLCDRVGRRPLFAISAIGCAISLFGEGVYFYIQEFYSDYASNISWLPTTALSAFMIINPIGLTSVPFILLSELFPSESKEISSSFLQLIMGFTCFAIAKAFIPLSNVIGVYTIFGIFGSFCLLGVIYIYMFIPETKGKSIAEIQDLLYQRENVPSYNKTKIII